MQPMILKDVAEAVEMHESTISRVTTGKYHHRRAAVQFRFFFSSHVPAEDEPAFRPRRSVPDRN